MDMDAEAQHHERARPKPQPPNPKPEQAADDVSQGATKGNSGIVHAGFDDKPGSGKP
jgi:hypothetical protein